METFDSYKSGNKMWEKSGTNSIHNFYHFFKRSGKKRIYKSS